MVRSSCPMVGLVVGAVSITPGTRAAQSPGRLSPAARAATAASVMIECSPDYRIIHQPVSNLTEYSRIPIAFTVDRILEVTLVDNGLGGLLLEETKLDAPYVKDYDAIEGNAPASWPARWDLSNWGMITAF